MGIIATVVVAIFLTWLLTKFMRMMEAPGFFDTAAWVLCGLYLFFSVVMPLLGTGSAMHLPHF